MIFGGSNEDHIDIDHVNCNQTDVIQSSFDKRK